MLEKRLPSLFLKIAKHYSNPNKKLMYSKERLFATDNKGRIYYWDEHKKIFILIEDNRKTKVFVDAFNLLTHNKIINRSGQRTWHELK